MLIQFGIDPLSRRFMVDSSHKNTKHLGLSDSRTPTRILPNPKMECKMSETTRMKGADI